MITKEDILEKLLNTCIGDKHREILKLALKGLESEDLICGHRIVVNNLNYEIDGLNRSRNFWRKKYESLANELDDKIIALEERLKANDAYLVDASKIINDAREKHRSLEAQLKNTIPLQFHDETVATTTRRISILIIERDAFQRLAGDLQTEKSCMRADLENVCKELGVLKGEIEKWEEAHCAKNSDIDKLLTENKKLARREREFSIVLAEWAAVEVYLAKSPKLTIGDKFSVACLRLLQERDKLEADLRFLLGH